MGASLSICKRWINNFNTDPLTGLYIGTDSARYNQLYNSCATKFSDNSTIKIIMWILIILAIIAVIIYIVIYLNNKESFDNRVMTIDGHCFNKKKSIVDYYSKKYPFYGKGSYYQPLENLDPDDKIDFERSQTTNLYTSQK